MNRVILVGNITKDIELKKSSNGLNYCRFTLAVPRGFVNEKGEKESDFINLVAWRTLAETISKYVKKGDKLGVIAKLQTRTWKENEETKYATDIIADEIEFLNTKKASEKKDDKKGITDSDLPF